MEDSVIAYRISEQTQQFIDNVAGYLADRANGREVEGLSGARMIALAALKFDLEGQIEREHEHAIAHRELESRSRAALEARRCQCARLDESGHCRHGSWPAIDTCEYYYMTDVPAIEGAKLCVRCYIATARERGLPLAEDERG